MSASSSDLPTWQVFTFRHGTRRSLRSEVFLDYALYGEPDDAHTVDYYFWALRSADRIIVVDTGYASEVAARRDRIVLHDPIEMLAEHLGVDADDVTDVVVTHCHYDHIGNLSRFPRAEVHLAAAELAFVRSGALSHQLVGHFSEPAEVDLLDSLDRAGRITAVVEPTDLAPGVRLIPVGGHTPGQLMVEVHTSAGPVLLTSDALHFREELDRDMPFSSCMDLPATYRTFETIRAYEAAGSRLVPGHDAGALDGMTRIATDVGVIG